jgi:pyrroline-5-carboxylate reductase
MTNPPKIAFLGAGNMASALIRGALASGQLAPGNVGATDVRREATMVLERDLAIRVFATNLDACAWADVVVLAVKPQVLPGVLAELRGKVTDKQLVISIVAGVSTERISQSLGSNIRVVRSAPNTPAMVNAGATALSKGALADEADLDLAESLFAATGIVVRVEERLLDAVTGLSGSGPAYVFLAIEALSDAGLREGLPRDVATKLAAQTLLGAAKMVLTLGEHPAKLKDMVTSPGGTTIAGIAALEREGLRNALHAAVEAAAARSRELGS